MTSLSVAERKHVAFAFEPCLIGPKVLDHAVVRDRHALAADMRMGVYVGRRAVRGPASVADADMPGAGDSIRFSSKTSIRLAVMISSKRPPARA